MKRIFKLFFILLVLFFGACDYNLISFKGGIKIVKFKEATGDIITEDSNVYQYAPYPFLDTYWFVVETSKTLTVYTFDKATNKEIANAIKECKEENDFSGSYMPDQPLSMIFYGVVIIFILLIPVPKRNRGVTRKIEDDLDIDEE